jgi:hypothetical protein
MEIYRHPGARGGKAGRQGGEQKPKAEQWTQAEQIK